ncbi:hypothetical protein [Chitinophaga solisilvae]|uniref:Uncharacterized protein n=1 Tax=Chitinophaga solisilvae TaxID=1233460 RepID=A0A9Q5DA47_9BACT|nr:hypothetical protein [Chitinophaga solisilvae]NSL86535.1 hypothetical protein [Chitinophaga solisilvae]
MKPFIYKCCMVVCLAGMLSILLFACNSSREASREADSAATTIPKVDSTSTIPVDTNATKPDSTRR